MTANPDGGSDPESTRTVTVLIADELPVVREGLKALLSRSPGVAIVGEATTARDVARLAILHRPNVVVVDPELLGARTDTTIREVRRMVPLTAVLVFTSDDDGYAVVAALRAGARGYLTKNASDKAIMRAVYGLAVGEAVLGPGVVDQLISGIGSPQGRNQDAFPELTARERDVFELLAAGMRNAAIADRLQLSPKT